MLKFSLLTSFQGYVCFRVWEGGFESNNSNEMVVRGILATTDITCKVRAIDVEKMVKSKYEVTINLSLFETFVTFVAFLSHPTISKEYINKYKHALS